MNWKDLNNLIKNIQVIQSHQSKFDRDPLLEEDLYESLHKLRIKYGNFIQSKITALYNNYFPFDQVEFIESYLSDKGVEVEHDQYGHPRLLVSLKSHPLRIELYDPKSNASKVAWQIS